jgi:general secretion pathway protein G
MKFRDSRGWTLIELLIVISLISILATIGMVSYRNSVTAAKESILKTDLFRLRDAIDQYYADKGEYPASLDTLVSEGYLRKVPDDPFTRAADWQTPRWTVRNTRTGSVQNYSQTFIPSQGTTLMTV